MYLGTYQDAGEFSEIGGYFSEHPNVWEYLEFLNVDLQAIWQAAGVDPAEYEDDADELVADEVATELAHELIHEESKAVYRILEEHFGWDYEVYLSLVKSMGCGNELETGSDAGISVHSYVRGGMSEWWWT